MADGTATACGCLDNDGSLTIGDLRTTSLAEIGPGERYQAITSAFLDHNLSPYPMCAKCDIPHGNFDGTFNERPA